MRNSLFDRELLEHAARVMFDAQGVFELRAVEATLQGAYRRGVVSGYFSEPHVLADVLSNVSSAKGIYITLNPVNEALQARACDRLRLVGPREPLTSDGDIVRRRWLLVDIDAERPSGISATEAEHDAALAKAGLIRAALAERGWPEPLFGDSGNGGHLLYRIDLPANDGRLVTRCLQALHDQFSDDAVKVDLSVGNPARITKLFGTLVCKGDNVPDRPHRMARLIDVPDPVGVVSDELLTALAAQATIPTTAAAHRQGVKRSQFDTFDIRSWIAAHFPEAKGPKATGNDSVWELPSCPWNDEHCDSAFIKLWANGTIGAGCHHNSCQGKGWHELRDAVEPGRRERRSETSKVTVRRAAERHQPRITLAAYLPFPVDVLPPVLRTYVKAVSQATASDVAFAALPALTACAAAIGNSRRLRGANKAAWEVPPILWTACVGESGSGKSPPLSFCLRSVKDREARLHQAYRSEFTKYEQDLIYFEKELADWKRSKDNGADPPAKPTPPQAQRCLVSDTTIEALAPVLQDNPRGLLLARDELAGWFGSFDRYAGRGRASADAAQWLSVFDGDSIFVDRKTGLQRLFVPGATVCVCGGIQPAVLRKALSSDHRENGLAARLLFAYPPRRPKRWSDADVEPSVECAFVSLLDRLHSLQGSVDEQGNWRPAMLGMTPAAKTRFVDYFNDHNAAGVNYDGDMSAAWAKLEGYALRLALVIHLVRLAGGDQAADPELVDDQSVEAGVELCRWFAHEASRVYNMLDESPAEQEARQLVELVHRRGGAITVRELQHACRRYRGSAEESEAALGDLVAVGLGEWHTIPAGPAGGRATREFRLHDAGNGNTTLLNPDGNEGSVTVTGCNQASIDEARTASGATSQQKEHAEWVA